MKHLIPIIVALAMFMEGIDTTIINTAIPAMSRSLAVNPIDLKVALISYLLSLAIFIPISGWIADKFGVKRVFIAALIVFTLSSWWCGSAHNLPELIIARIVQGFGGSLSVPVGRLIIVRFFQRHELITVMNRVIMIAAIGPMLGPALGGMITHHYSWRWIFWVNIPFGMFTALLAWYGLKDESPRPVPPLDTIGFLLFGIGLASITFGLSALSESTFSLNVGISAILLAALALGLYIWHSRGRSNPIVKTELFTLRTFQVSALGGLLCRLSFGGMPFMLPLMLQISLGYSSQTAGFLMAPIAIGLLVTKTFTRPLLRQFGFRRLLFMNTILIGFSLWSFMLLNAHTPLYFIAILTFFFGLLLSLQFSSMNPIAYANAPRESLNSITSIASTIQQLSMSFGVAISALLLLYFSGKSHAGTLSVAVFQHAFLVLGFITILSASIFLHLKPEDGIELINETQH